MRSMVEGAHVDAMRDDASDHAVQILEHIPRRNAHDVERLTPQQGIPRCITPRLIAKAVPLAIDLNNQPVAETGKVSCDSICWELTPKLQSLGPQSKRVPQYHLWQAHLSPQLPCAFHLLDRCLKDAWAHSTTRLCRAVPLPVPGRIIELRAAHSGGHPVVRDEKEMFITFHAPFSRTRSK